MTQKQKRLLNAAIGVALFGVASWLLPGRLFTQQAAIALGTLIAMVYWWVTRPVHLAVTALLPIVVVSLFNIGSMSEVLSEYASPIVVLLMGANLLSLIWVKWGLDKRIALRLLSIVGVSVRQQLLVWLGASVLLSTVLPNAVVAATLCPIAMAMMAHCGESDMSKEEGMAQWILLAIVWGAGIGGFGTPLGGAMNLVVINHIEALLGSEYMFFMWIKDMLPLLLVMTAITGGFFLLIKLPVLRLPGSREYFRKNLQEMPPMTGAEKRSLLLFASAVALAFLRPLYETALPQLKPPFSFLIAAFLAFFLKGNDDKPLIQWGDAVKELNWGLMLLFSGGLAAGTLLVSTGAADAVAKSALHLRLTQPIVLMLIFVVLGTFLANTSSNTAACAALIPVVIGIASNVSVELMPLIAVTAAACNCAFVLPTSIRAIPVSYGMNTRLMLRSGLKANSLVAAALLLAGWLYIQLY